MIIDKRKLIELLDFGADIEFFYNGKTYTILAWTENGISIGMQDAADNQVYPSREDFIKNCKIDGVPILKALPQINILYHS